MARIFLALLLCVSGMTTVKAQPLTGPGVDPNALLLMDFEDGNIASWSVTNTQQNRGEKQSIELMDAEKGDPVRFGRYAVKLNWDFTAGVSGTTLGSYFSPPGNAFKIPAGPNPRKIGMWIYASPECQGVIWFRLQLFTPAGAAGSGSSVVSVFGNEISYNYWTGWKYHEFDFPAGGANKELGPPAASTASYAMFRLMSVSSASVQRPLTKGYFIIDNIRITSAAEDLIPPTISGLTGNGISLPAAGTPAVLTASTVDFFAAFNDPGGSNATGINFNSIRVIVDGYTFKEGDTGFSVVETNATSGNVSLTGLNLSNGQHTVVIHVEDNFGHITTRTSTFTVDDPTAPESAATLVADNQAFVGNPFEMKINSSNSKNVKELELVIELNEVGSIHPVTGVTFAASAQENSTYSFKTTPLGGLLTINLKNDIPEEQEETTETIEETLATIKINISKNSNPTDVLRVSPVIAKATYMDDSPLLFKLFNAFAKNITPLYNLTVTKRVVGVPGEVLVTDMSENPVVGATVYALNAAMSSTIAVATTDENGIALLNFTGSAQNVNIYVEKDGGYSYTIPKRTLTAQLGNTPTYIRAGVAPDPTSSKTITWMSNPQSSTGPAIMKVAKKYDDEPEFKEYTGKTKMLEFDISNSVAKGSAVTVEGLEPGTTYIYQVGDGTSWSPIREFTTTTVSDKFSFSAFGDVQASQTAQMSRFLAAAATIEAMDTKPLFSLNVGDVPDTDDNFTYAQVYGYLLNERHGFANIDMVSTYGNHEYMGNPDADNIKFMNGHPRPAPSSQYNADLVGTGSYVVRYGNMMVFSLDWEPKGNAAAIQTEQAKWIDEILTDNPDVVWKIITLHYPIYAGSTPGSLSRLGPVLDKHNIQIVFCGHGHVYERVQVKNGSTTSPINGTFVPKTDGGTLHIQMGDMTATGANGRWLFCEVNGGKMEVLVRDANNRIVENQCFTLFASEDWDNSNKVISVSNMYIYPNPFADVLRIKGAENSTLTIINIVGMVAHTQNISSANEAINLGRLPAGLYLFRIEKDGQTQTAKVMKK